MKTVAKSTLAMYSQRLWNGFFLHSSRIFSNDPPPLSLRKLFMEMDLGTEENNNNNKKHKLIAGRSVYTDRQKQIDDREIKTTKHQEDKKNQK